MLYKDINELTDWQLLLTAADDCRVWLCPFARLPRCPFMMDSD